MIRKLVSPENLILKISVLKNNPPAQKIEIGIHFLSVRDKVAVLTIFQSVK
jgi:hypothetical protein